MIGRPSWEGFALEKTLNSARPDDAFFYTAHSGSELDLLMIKSGKRIGVDFKRADAPKITRSMRIAMEDIKLDELIIVHPGEHAFQLEPNIRSLPLKQISNIA